MILDNRTAWNVQRLYWFLWRDPDPNSSFAHRCSFCSSAGLLQVQPHQEERLQRLRQLHDRH